MKLDEVRLMVIHRSFLFTSCLHVVFLHIVRHQDSRDVVQTSGDCGDHLVTGDHPAAMAMAGMSTGSMAPGADNADSADRTEKIEKYGNMIDVSHYHGIWEFHILMGVSWSW